MFWKSIVSFFGFLFVLFAIIMLFVYWFVPSGSVEYILNPEFRNNYNFSLETGEVMQFYENLRYPSSNISYNIEDSCTLKRKDDMKIALDTVESKTVIDFYQKTDDGEIMITCEDKIKVKERFFIAGEGGPINITQTGNFNVISHGSILLLKDSKCEKPNVAIHELLHALGFDHSSNPNSIMYNISKCHQVMGDDIIKALNEIYSIESKADLSFENVSATAHGRYLDFNISIRNKGLVKAEESNLIISADDKSVKEIPLNIIEAGSGITLTLTNIWVPQISVNEIEFNLDSEFEELNKNNNVIKLEIKK